MFAAIQHFDDAVLALIQKAFQSPAMDAVMRFFTALGDAGFVWILIAIALIASKKYRKYGIAMGISLGVMLLCNNLILKNLVGRIRPFVANPDIRLLISTPSGSSFPSGHAASSFAGAFCLACADWRFAPFGYLLAVLISFSRLYLYVHYPSDVLFGAITGTLYALAVILLAKRSKKWNKKVA